LSVLTRKTRAKTAFAPGGPSEKKERFVISSHRAPVPVRLLPFFVEIQNARVWPFVIPPVRSARLQDVFLYGNCTETRKIRRGTFTGFSHDWQPLGAYPVFSDLQAKGRQLRLLHRGTPSPAQRGIFRGSERPENTKLPLRRGYSNFSLSAEADNSHFEFSPQLWLTAEPHLLT
jgi:hypothetical protein